MVLEQAPNRLQVDGDAILSERGIYDAAQKAGWYPMRYYNQPGWAFPLYQANGQKWMLEGGREARRWKAFDSDASPKYSWGWPDQQKGEERKPENCHYYWLPGTADAILKMNGVLHITAGEPDMLTLLEQGWKNVTTFFGEMAIPDNLVHDLQRLGVKKVTYYPDTDDTGVNAAIALYEALEGSDIAYSALMLPHAGKKTDLNSLWQQVDFDTKTFLGVLLDAKQYRFNKTEEPPQMRRKDFDRIGYEQALDKQYADIANALGVTEYKRNGFSNPISCLFAAHEHDDKNPAAAWHQDKHIMVCFKCGQTWLGDEVAERLGISKVDWNAYMPDATTQEQVKVEVAELADSIVYSSDQSIQRYRERMRGLHVSSFTPIPFPFRVLHHLQGYAQVMKPRKITGILGLSGGGKTSFMETAGDALRQQGIDLLWWGPEWSWEEMTDRTVQRYGGLTITEMMQHETYLAEQRQREEQGHATNFGVEGALDKINRTDAILDTIEGWPGKSYFVDKMGLALQQLLDVMDNTIIKKRGEGRNIRVVVFDYAQLLEVSGARSDMERINKAVGMIKTFCADTNMIGVVATQPRKNDSSTAKARSGNDSELTSESARYLVDDPFNLFITLNPVMDAQMNKGVISVTKNSGGTREKVPVYIDFKHLTWKDERLPAYLANQVLRGDDDV